MQLLFQATGFIWMHDFPLLHIKCAHAVLNGTCQMAGTICSIQTYILFPACAATAWLLWTALE